MGPHQADVVLWPEELHHEVEVLTLLQLLGTLGPMPVVCLVPMELLFTWGFLCWLRAGLSCLSIVPSILQPQDSSMEHCKALPGKAVGNCYGPSHLSGRVHQSHQEEGLLKQVSGPRHSQ